MTLQEGLKMTGVGKITIPDCSRSDLPQLFVELGFKVGAEVGVLTGNFTEEFCKAGLKMSAIDPWLMFYDYQHPRGQKRLDQQYEQTKKTLEPYGANIIRKISMDAVEEFPLNSLDFVYIDGNHHFRYVAEDIVEWTRRVRPGGIVCGHDFFYSTKKGENAQQVRWVVEAYVAAHQIPTYYVLGKQKRKDKWPSWMFFKPNE